MLGGVVAVVEACKSVFVFTRHQVFTSDVFAQLPPSLWMQVASPGAEKRACAQNGPSSRARLPSSRGRFDWMPRAGELAMLLGVSSRLRSLLVPCPCSCSRPIRRLCFLQLPPGRLRCYDLRHLRAFDSWPVRRRNQRI